MLYGNVEMRQVALAFNGSERIAEVLVEEGSLVHKGQVLARLDTSRLAPQVAQAEAQVASQQAVVERLRNGSRPEEIAQARAQLEAAKAEALNARRQHERREALAARSFASEQESDIAKAAADIADAKVTVAQRALELSIAGPRRGGNCAGRSATAREPGATRASSPTTRRRGTEISGRCASFARA